MTEKIKLLLDIEWTPGIMTKKWKILEGDKFSEEFKDEIWDEYSIDVDELKKETEKK